MTFFITDLHNDLRQARLTRRGASLGDAAPTGLHKAYPRMRQIALPAPSVPDRPFAEVLFARTSAQSAPAAAPLSKEDLGTLFGLAMGVRDDTKRRTYPSGGALYPIEAYLVVSCDGGIGAGVYHYHPTRHALERLWDLPARVEAHDLVVHPDGLGASALVVLTGLWERSAAKYGDFAYILALLEAGHVSQNLLLAAAALELRARPLAAFDEPALADLLDLDAGREQVVETIILAKPSRP